MDGNGTTLYIYFVFNANANAICTLLFNCYCWLRFLCVLLNRFGLCDHYFFDVIARCCCCCCFFSVGHFQKQRRNKTLPVLLCVPSIYQTLCNSADSPIFCILFATIYRFAQLLHNTFIFWFEVWSHTHTHNGNTIYMAITATITILLTSYLK